MPRIFRVKPWRQSGGSNGGACFSTPTASLGKAPENELVRPGGAAQHCAVTDDIDGTGLFSDGEQFAVGGVSVKNLDDVVLIGIKGVLSGARRLAQGEDSSNG